MKLIIDCVHVSSRKACKSSVCTDQESVVPDLASHLCTGNIMNKLVFGEFAELFLGFEGRSDFRVTEPSLCAHTSAVNISHKPE